jgi:hypothetical protein
MTTYQYDRLTQVVQGVQTRSYAYDRLVRKTSETNPESGTSLFVYNAPVIVPEIESPPFTLWIYNPADELEKRFGGKKRGGDDWIVTCSIHIIGLPNHQGEEQKLHTMVTGAVTEKEAIEKGKPDIEAQAKKRFRPTGWHTQHCDAKQWKVIVL